MSPTEAAEALGIHRSTVYARLGTIRKAAEALDLAAYLGAAPTVSEARR
jgi:RNA polymerase sigma-70 factor (ECF subfamily)